MSQGLRPDTPLTALRGIGPKTEDKLAASGLRMISDLLFHLPRRYEDRREVMDPGGIEEEGRITVRGRARRLRVRRLGGRRSLVEGTVEGETGDLPVVWFNQSYLEGRLEGRELLLHGDVRRRDGRLVLTHPDWEERSSDRTADSGRIHPVYPGVTGVGERRLRRWIRSVIDDLDLQRWFPETLPVKLLERRDLVPLPEPLVVLHDPPTEIDLSLWNESRSSAHRRLVYGELLGEQLVLARRRSERMRQKTERAYRVDDRTRELAREILPFRLTKAQKRVLRQLVEGLRRPSPMRSLLQGDVGSGKTIVAALLLMLALESELQGALLAPTEILAEQHFLALRRLFGDRYSIVLLTAERGSEEERRAVAAGTAGLVVGTHALFQEDLEFRRLGLIVIDEQHRFGVEQRRKMVEKGQRPDLLVMSATPIPRSLALTAYGDLEMVVLDELPPGRKPVETLVLPAAQRRRAYSRLRSDLQEGAQGYVVFPAIRESAELDLPSLEREGAEILKSFTGHEGAMLHGRLPLEERERIVESFRRGEIRLLLATSVIEVGVDVPAATAMIIEGAERFGLAQLHQLRGRVGRGESSSWCTAIHDTLTEAGRERMRVFRRAPNGFALAEQDLRIRGPGELLGRRQAGEAGFRFADLRQHLRLLESARGDAIRLVAEDRVPSEVLP